MKKQVFTVLLGCILLMGCSGTIPKLGVDNGQLVPCPDSPNCVISQTTDKEHFLIPIQFNGTMQEAKDRMLNVLNTLQQTKIIDVQENYIRVEFKSKIFGFIDDAEFYFLPTTGNNITINVRSASRIGHSDFGVNRKRIEQIRSKFEVDG